mmetsp:Transcript_32453/g.59856  ORF Transcript_32453/g.59856 Transcript_32453/m.59856 type:complete len:82 (-) Transcript_32453:1152-1397(-)
MHIKCVSAPSYYTILKFYSDCGKWNICLDWYFLFLSIESLRDLPRIVVPVPPTKLVIDTILCRCWDFFLLTKMLSQMLPTR